MRSNAASPPAHDYLTRRSSVARKNVELTMENVHRRSAVLEDLESSGAIKIVGAMYNLETGMVEFFS